MQKLFSSDLLIKFRRSSFFRYFNYINSIYIKPKLNSLFYWVLFFNSFYLFQIFTNWWTLRITRGGAPEFWDLNIVLRWAKCFETYGLGVYKYQVNDSCTGYVYGSNFLRALSLFNLYENYTRLLGLLFLFFISALMGGLSEHLLSDKKMKKSLILVVFCSPPIWLLVASGNFDILIIYLILFSALLFFHNYKGYSLMLLSCATIIKFYTFPLLLIVFLSIRKKRLKIFSAACLVVVTLIVVSDLKYTRGNSTFASEYFFTFGVINPGAWWNILVNKLNFPDLGLSVLQKYLFGFLLMGLVTYWIARLTITRASNIINAVPSELKFDLEETIFSFFGITYCVLFLQGGNFDYKLFYLAVAGLFYIRVYQKRIIFTLLLAASLWMSCFSFGLSSEFVPSVKVSTIYVAIQLFGDAANFIITSFILVALFEMFTSKKFSKH